MTRRIDRLANFFLSVCMSIEMVLYVNCREEEIFNWFACHTALQLGKRVLFSFEECELKVRHFFFIRFCGKYVLALNCYYITLVCARFAIRKRCVCAFAVFIRWYAVCKRHTNPINILWSIIYVPNLKCKSPIINPTQF